MTSTSFPLCLDLEAIHPLCARSGKLLVAPTEASADEVQKAASPDRFVAWAFGGVGSCLGIVSLGFAGQIQDFCNHDKGMS